VNKIGNVYGRGDGFKRVFSKRYYSLRSGGDGGATRGQGRAKCWLELNECVEGVKLEQWEGERIEVAISASSTRSQSSL
jgi:hypothetical protein